jgi:lysozyme-like protein
MTNRLTDGQIAALAAAQGLSGTALVTAVAVCLAESGGDADINGPTVTTNWGNGNFTTHAVGLWQILLGPGRPGEAALRNPDTNAQWMKKLSSGGKKWTPWEAYTNGRYLRFWSRAQKAAKNPSAVPPTGSTQPAGDVIQASWIGSATDFFQLVTDPITWMRVTMILGGGIMLAIGLFMLSGQADRLAQGAKMAVDFIPGGKVTKGLVKAA